MQSYLHSSLILLQKAKFNIYLIHITPETNQVIIKNVLFFSIFITFVKIITDWKETTGEKGWKGIWVLK